MVKKQGGNNWGIVTGPPVVLVFVNPSIPQLILALFKVSLKLRNAVFGAADVALHVVVDFLLLLQLRLRLS